MFLRFSSAFILVLIGLSAAQTTTPAPSDECFNTVIDDVTESYNNVLENLDTLKQGVAEGIAQQIVNATEEIQEDVQNFLTNLRAVREETSEKINECLNQPFGLKSACFGLLVSNFATKVATDIAQLAVHVVKDILVQSSLSSIIGLNSANLNATLASIVELSNYIATAAPAIQSCLNSKLPLLGALLG